MSELGRVQFGNATIKYEVQRSQRRKKTVQITMDGGRVLVAAPEDTPSSKLDAIVIKRARWVLGQEPESVLRVSQRRFVSGETLPYLGRNVRLIVETADVPSTTVRFDHWSFRIIVPARLAESKRYDEIGKVVVQWYRQRAVERLPKVVEVWRKRMGWPESPEVLIRDQRQRWGSCAPDGTLRFNWRVVMLTPTLLEYVVVHELAHLKISSHSTEYWALVSSLLWDTQQRRHRLREVGKLLPM